MTVLVMPAAQIICFFSENLLQIWTRYPAVSSHTGPILSLLIIGTAMNGMKNISYAAQLAYGWTKLAMNMNLTAIAILISVLIVMVSAYGAVGGAIIWVTLNAGYILFGLRLMHRRILKNQLRRWFVADFGLPGGASLIVVALGWSVFPKDSSEIFMVFWIVVTYAFSCLAAIFTIPEFRLTVSAWLNSSIIDRLKAE